jgi:hypothetical protein
MMNGTIHVLAMTANITNPRHPRDQKQYPGTTTGKNM